MLYYFDDDLCQTELSQFMLGKSVLVAPVTEQGLTKRDVYLPVSDGGWYRWSPNAESESQWFAGGETITVEAPLGQLPVFVRAGSVLPVATKWHRDRPHDATEIALTCFAHPTGGVCSQSVFYDDGLSWNYKTQQGCNLQVHVQCNASEIQVQLEHHWSADDAPQWSVEIIGLAGRRFTVS